MENVTSVRKVAPYVNIVAPAANTLVHILSQGRTGRIKKIHLHNLTGAVDVVTLGEVIGGVWTQRQPGVHSAFPGSLQIGEFDLPAFEYETDVYARSGGAGAATPMSIQIEIEEIG